jgi:hypothetical protein
VRQAPHTLFSFASLPARYDYYSRQPSSKLDEVQARFIIAECVLALEYIHRYMRMRPHNAPLIDFLVQQGLRAS